MKYHEIDKFTKEFNKLESKFRTLSDDLKNAKRNAIELLFEKEIDNNSSYEIPGFHNKACKIYKLKKFTCKFLKGKGVHSGIRIIYAYFPETKEIYFLEIYYKGKKENEDNKRIRAFIKERCK